MGIERVSITFLSFQIMLPKLSYLEGVTQQGSYKNSKNLTDLLLCSYEYLKGTCNGGHKHLFAAKITARDIDSCYRQFDKIVSTYNKEDILESINLLKRNLIVKDNWNLNDDVLKKNSITYRFRLPRHKGDEIYEIYNREELFHMPFDSLQSQGNQRYSINGFPCLYLGKTIYDCWEETRRADLSKVNYAAFKNKKDLNVVVIECPSKIAVKEDIIRYFMFSLCTKMVSLDDDVSSFKFHYVIPELLLTVLINQMKTNKHYKYEGIRFVSSRYYDESLNMFRVKPIFYNYVFPIQEPADKGHCSRLKNIFRVSEVRADYMIKLKQLFLPYPAVYRSRYDQSYFRRLELEIENGRLGEFKKIVDKK